jgi:hypothetical protein
MKTINTTKQNSNDTVEIDKALKNQNNFLVGSMVFITFTYSILLVLL